MAERENLERQKRLCKLTFARIHNRLLDIPKKPASVEVIELLEAEFTDFKDEKAKFDDIQQKLSPLLLTGIPADDEKTEDTWTTECEKNRTTLTLVRAKINTMKRNMAIGVSRDSILDQTMRENSEPSGIRLPKIEAPTFSGDIRDWNDFQNLYKNLVHENPAFSNVQRLYYLKNAMKNDASNLIKDFAITDANYTEAWNTLTIRYGNKRAVIKAHFRDLFALSKIKHEREIRKLLDDSAKTIRSLKALGENTDGWNAILTYWISSRLDDRTKRDWENSINDFSKFPNLKQLRTFLSTRAAVIEDTGAAKKFEKTETKPQP